MKIRMKKRALRHREIASLVEEIKKFPNPLTDRKGWQSLKKAYILYIDRELVGVCGVGRLNNWLKLGPFVVLKNTIIKGMEEGY